MAAAARRFLLWLALTAPLAALVGFVLALFLGDPTDLRRTESVFGGAVGGAVAGVFGAAAATVTTLVGRPFLQRAGGSELATGAVVAYGAAAAGLLLLRFG